MVTDMNIYLQGELSLCVLHKRVSNVPPSSCRDIRIQQLCSLVGVSFVEQQQIQNLGQPAPAPELERVLRCPTLPSSSAYCLQQQDVLPLQGRINRITRNDMCAIVRALKCDQHLQHIISCFRPCSSASGIGRL